MLLFLAPSKTSSRCARTALVSLVPTRLSNTKQLYFKTLHLLAVFLFSQPLAFGTDAVNNAENVLRKEITTILSSHLHPYLTPADFSQRYSDLDALYKLNNYQSLWLNKPHSAAKIAELLEVLKNAPNDGLVAEKYNSQVLSDQLQDSLALQSSDYHKLALYDTALSISLLRYLHDLHYGRVTAQGVNFNLKLREKKDIDFRALIYSAASQGHIVELTAQVEPKLKQYQKLKSALTAYRQLAQTVLPVKLSSKLIKPGDPLPEFTELSDYLIASGDLEAIPDLLHKKPAIYSEMLVTAIKKFQNRHGLPANGLIGKATQTALLKPMQERVTQIELAMERLRWLPEPSSGKSIIVNIPAFQLWAFDDNDVFNSKLSNMRVVVGKAEKNQTPVLMAEMRFIDFMPYWNVPYTIVKTEILPKLVVNPGYLAKENMEIVSNNGVLPVNSASMSLLKQGTARIRQKPGGKNALGKIKFMFPNKEDVYLHDTPSQSLFSRIRRDFSHGCVRVANPEGLAEFVLAGQLDAVAIKKALNTPQNQRVLLKKAIPVLFFYSTAYFDHENTLVFYPDVYGQDVVLMEALKNTDDLPDKALFANLSGADQQPVATPLPESDTLHSKPDVPVESIPPIPIQF